ncbi:methylated-DNA--[protein]-cysteine S-methyltransferase [Rhizosaccharibacter radicis]|uniref:Methylated-DNA--[protein]-cysteine S-methyltransferase n=1 Tax=Rhizosaccharibacter radicis TaxID=2782605 RepID=A0ABT1VSW2_9PROT|nr:methylated-DNA--[protein]-cysteine S-methyltransferase [Acetobacteraceae bacterium KSS12]
MPQLSFHSPLGALTLSEEDGSLVALDWGWARDQDQTDLLRRARDQLQDYFDGSRRPFSLPLNPAGGTPYRRRVWDALQRIPLGQVRSYGDMAVAVGGSPRSIGGAVGFNPLPILIPCHRVVAGTHLGGFSAEGGVATKRWLLELEEAAMLWDRPGVPGIVSGRELAA